MTDLGLRTYTLESKLASIFTGVAFSVVFLLMVTFLGITNWNEYAKYPPLNLMFPGAFLLGLCFLLYSFKEWRQLKRIIEWTGSSEPIEASVELTVAGKPDVFDAIVWGAENSRSTPIKLSRADDYISLSGKGYDKPFVVIGGKKLNAKG